MSKIEVEGLRELERALLNLEKKTSTKILRQAGRYAMKPVLDAAIAGVNVDTGDTRKAMAISYKKGKGESVAYINVGATRKRALKSQGGHALGNVNQRVLAQEYGTRRQKAEPFLANALESNTDVVLSRFREMLTKKIGEL